MSYPQIRLNKTKKIQNVLKYLEERFPLLNESDILKMALSQVYFMYKKQDELSECKKRAQWEMTLPEANISKEEEESIVKGIKDKGKIMDVDEVISAIKE